MAAEPTAVQNALNGHKECTLMAHEAVDGMLTVAKLKRGLLGGAVYTDVTIRRDDGDVRRLGTVMVLSNMTHAMVPGSRGRFYAYNVLGTKGVYGFRPHGRPSYGAFPVRFEMMLLGMAVANLLLAIFFVATGSGFAWLSGVTSLVTLAGGALFLATRLGAMRAYRADDPVIPSDADLRRARA
jgi:hypothetical protein